MRAYQKLVRNGNATAVTVPRTMLIHLGWLPGESIILELLESDQILLRRPELRDFAPVGPPRLVRDEPATVTK